MSKAIFLGDSIYPWLGMREILRGSSLFIDITYYSSQTLSAVKMLPYETDCIIINPDKSDFLKYARIIRNMALRPVTKIIVLADEATFAIFQTVCGKNMQFLDQDTSLDQLLQTVTRITQNKKQQLNLQIFLDIRRPQILYLFFLIWFQNLLVGSYLNTDRLFYLELHFV